MENNIISKARIFVDMDGTIADLHAILDWWERVQCEPDFFRKLEPFPNLIAALFLVQLHYGNQVKISSLSAVSDGELNSAIKESKSIWMDENAQFIQERIFSVNGRRKSEIIGPLSKSDILLDDYTKNLNEWTEDGGTAIKVRNNINCVSGVWKGEVIYNQDTVSEIVKKLDSVLKQFL